MRVAELPRLRRHLVGGAVDEARRLPVAAEQPALEDASPVLLLARVLERGARLAHEGVGEVEEMIDSAGQLGERAVATDAEHPILQISLRGLAAHRGDRGDAAAVLLELGARLGEFGAECLVLRAERLMFDAERLVLDAERLELARCAGARVPRALVSSAVARPVSVVVSRRGGVVRCVRMPWSGEPHGWNVQTHSL